jgi:serine/threonine protein kinase
VIIITNIIVVIYVSLYYIGSSRYIAYVLEPLLYGTLRRVIKLLEDESTDIYHPRKRNSSGGPLDTEPSTPEQAFRLKMDLIRFYGICISSAVDFMRSHHVAHRDIRPENIAFSKDGYPKLIEFGMCTRFPYKVLSSLKSVKPVQTKALTKVGVAGMH